MIDVIVVGSGASGVHAAWPLVAAGLRVLMVDGGATDERYRPLIPAESFDQIRENDEEQHRYLLGDDFEGIPLGDVRVGAQLTPPRQHIAREAREMLAQKPSAFQAMETLALGGLAAGWGAVSPPFTDDELRSWPLSRADLQPHYEAVARRVGICGHRDDDLAPLLGPAHPLLPHAQPDANGAAVLQRYAARRRWFSERGLVVGHPRIALATRPFRGRGPVAYRDMEFWADTDRAVYRPVYTLEELATRANFSYRGRLLATAFREPLDGGVELDVTDLENGNLDTIRAGRLVLAAGAIGTARLALHSLGAHRSPVPIVSNPYTYFPCLVYTRLGKPTSAQAHSLTQVMMLFDPWSDAERLLQAQVYSYRSLLNFKLVKESPLAVGASIPLMRQLQPYFAIVGVHHEDRPGPGKSLWVEPPTSDEPGAPPPPLQINYAPTPTEVRRRRDGERRLAPLLRALGLLPLRRIDPGHGASIHYAGTLPMSLTDRPLTTALDGRLRGTRHVHVADGAAFPHLPAKGLTFTLMANANRIGEAVAKGMRE